MSRSRVSSYISGTDLAFQGDVQPFLALGQELREYGHRVRLATHPIFESLVRDHGLEYFSIGGDPAELMAVSILQALAHRQVAKNDS